MDNFWQQVVTQAPGAANPEVLDIWFQISPSPGRVSCFWIAFDVAMVSTFWMGQFLIGP